jgi:hypothetical protein
MPADISYISDFLNRPGVEGPRWTQGYIPCRPGNFTGKPNQNPAKYEAIGVSGVTIATGVDLGQTDEDSLRGYGVSESLIRKVSPYLGLTSKRAIYKLYNAPFQISPEEAAELDHHVHAGYLNRYVRPCYEKQSSVKFDELPKQAQAVVFSMCFQLGCGGVKRRAPKTWHYLTNQMWADASDELIYGFRDYAGRRKIEGMLLKEIL